MAKYEVHFYVSGRGTRVVEAANESDAEGKVEDMVSAEMDKVLQFDADVYRSEDDA